MRNRLVILIIAFLFIITPAFAAKTIKSKPKPKPKPAAVKTVKPAKPVEWAAKVNGDIISMELYNRRLAAATKQITKEISTEGAGAEPETTENMSIEAGAAEATEATSVEGEAVQAGETNENAQEIITETKRKILEQMIEAVILMQWAEREGLSVMDKTINLRIQDLKKSFPTAYEFHKTLAEQGMSIDDLKLDIKKQILIEKLINTKAKSMAVSDEEIQTFYDNNKDIYSQNEKLHLSQILAETPEEAEMIRASLEAGATLEWEDIGLVEKGQLPIADDSSVFALKAGEVSPVCKGEALGCYIFLVNEKLSGKETDLEEVKDLIRKFLLREKARTQFIKDLKVEKANAKITINEKLGKLF